MRIYKKSYLLVKDESRKGWCGGGCFIDGQYTTTIHFKTSKYTKMCAVSGRDIRVARVTRVVPDFIPCTIHLNTHLIHTNMHSIFIMGLIMDLYVLVAKSMVLPFTTGSKSCHISWTVIHIGK